MILDDKGVRNIASSSGPGSKYGDKNIQVSQSVLVEFVPKDHDGLRRFRDGKYGC